MSPVAAQIYTSVEGGSYNSFLNQVGFCKAQSFETISRNTSGSPSVFQDGRVLFGVGLSHAQFQKSIVSCGRCIQVLTIDYFYQFNQQLTEWDYNKPNHGNFTVIVFDECTDPICKSGFLDFDIYHEKQPVAYGNPSNITWRFVPCPVDDSADKIGFLFCMGYDSCKETDAEERNMIDLYHDAIHDNAFSVYPRNHRIAITSIKIQGELLHDNQAWLWKSYNRQLLEETKWLVEWTNEDGQQQSWVLDWEQYFDKTTTFGYKGGYIFQTSLQN